MKKIISIPSAVLIAIFLGFFGIFLIYLFPRIYLYLMNFIIILPILLIGLPCTAGIFTFLILKSSKKSNKALLTISIIILTMIIQITLPSMEPGSVSENYVWYQLYNYTETFIQYPSGINYDDLAFGNKIRRVAASVKYKESLPDRIAIISILKETGHWVEIEGKYHRENNSQELEIEYRCYLELKNNQISYDTGKFLLIQQGDDVLLTANPFSPEPTEFLLKRTKINQNLFMLNIMRVWYSDDFSYRYEISAHDFVPETGAEKLLYRFLSFKPSR